MHIRLIDIPRAYITMMLSSSVGISTDTVMHVRSFESNLRGLDIYSLPTNEGIKNTHLPSAFKTERSILILVLNIAAHDALHNLQCGDM